MNGCEFVNADIFERCHTSYEAINTMLRNIASQILGRKGAAEAIQELVSEGWMLVMEMLPDFDPERGGRVTTYLWPQINGRLRRYAVKQAREKNCIVPSDDIPDRATDCMPVSGIFEACPYRMAPDAVYERTEKARAWASIQDEFHSDISVCLNRCSNADSRTRTSVSRIRQRKIDKITARMMLLMNS